MFMLWFWFSPKNLLVLSLHPFLPEAVPSRFQHGVQRLHLHPAYPLLVQPVHQFVRVWLTAIAVLLLLFLLNRSYIAPNGLLLLSTASLLASALCWHRGMPHRARWAGAACGACVVAVALFSLPRP